MEQSSMIMQPFDAVVASAANATFIQQQTRHAACFIGIEILKPGCGKHELPGVTKKKQQQIATSGAKLLTCDSPFHFMTVKMTLSGNFLF